ncbi:GATA-type domain-containing protein [Chloropicon primus]|uniref:Uncharacterized protein n=1 Tax=Chloropicon primus TaxID=1764295 RepID=A0A5B8MEP5_9CHLO|nr:hypothetical protein A3770_02p13970 [Chloropicon primus]UPQ98086.1 GATA-type domain-containing protein [Chloropicon primus]|mmetsp:Transcript_13776/g.38893  ORF Transcript_13776/g.38893 Transcript_13776/m.38893 type:complete len:386 (+) Transcript_13776:46-1203(+)|eukprot:QDZ18879.1 hypothetical protein A3770_02p13970 [Chloropicon primus]
MGLKGKKKGPCDHCGETESPMWRKGPESKPLLCNACGARWITKRSLEGYMPMSKGGARKRKKTAGKVSRSGAGGIEASARKQQRKPSSSSLLGAKGGEIVASGKRKRKVPVKYQDDDEVRPSSAGKGKAAKGKVEKKVEKKQRAKKKKVESAPKRARKRANLKILVEEEKPGKVLDGIPSPQKPAKKRHTVRSLYVEDLASPRTTLPPKKKKHDVLLRYQYRKSSVLKSAESPLCHINLLSIVKESVLDACLSKEDKDVLATMLPEIDLGKEREDGKVSFGSAFRSDAFQSAVLNYQNLLKAGSFDGDLPASNMRMVDHYNRLTKEFSLSRWAAEFPEVGTRRTRGDAPSQLPAALQTMMQEALAKREPVASAGGAIPLRQEVTS